MDKNKNIYIVRHAESEANIGKFTPDVVNIKLTQKGIYESTSIVNSISEVNRIYVSKYIRTTETALPLARKFTSGKLTQLNNIHEFTYIKIDNTYGALDLERHVSKYWKNLDPYYKMGDEAETFEEFVKRVQSFAMQIKKFPNFTYIFSHRNFITMTLLILSEFKDEIDKNFNRGELIALMQQLLEKRNDITHLSITNLGVLINI